MKKIIDIKNEELPIGKIIRQLLLSLPKADRVELQEKMTVDEFVSHRVDIYLKELELALLDGILSPAGAEEVAREACMSGLANS